MNWSNKRCVVLDMDGTVYLGNIPIKGAVQFIQKHWKDLDFYFLTNNTSKSLSTYVTKLKSMGIPAQREILLSPVLPLVNFLRERQIQRIYLVGNRDFAQELHAKMPSLEESEDNVQAVVLAYDTELTYQKLMRSALLLQKPDILFLATHPDLVCPSPEGPLPDVGSFISLYATATGRRPQYIFGKPDPMILQPLLARYAKDDMVMVGDRLSTDKKLAENAGIDFALVLSGEATREDLAKEERQPTVVLEHLGEAEKDFL
ncbi:MAG: HAD-IIA family hydrolase [Desulfovibrio sp.]|nr:HAD-IIA family hydrolase [Desulfovibrio sp.]